MTTQVVIDPLAAQLQSVFLGFRRWMFVLVPPACASLAAGELPRLYAAFTVSGQPALACELAVYPDNRPGLDSRNNLLVEIWALSEGTTLVETHYYDLYAQLISLGLEPFRHTSKSMAAQINIRHNPFMSALP